MIEITSLSQHLISSSCNYIYHSNGIIASVLPDISHLQGGVTVEIKASPSHPFCEDINDVEYVTLAGIKAQVLSAGKSGMKVIAGESKKSIDNGDIVIASISYGVTTGRGMFSYNDRQVNALSALGIILGILGGIGIVGAGVWFMTRYRPHKSDVLLDDVGGGDERFRSNDNEVIYSAMDTSKDELARAATIE